MKMWTNRKIQQTIVQFEIIVQFLHKTRNRTLAENLSVLVIVQPTSYWTRKGRDKLRQSASQWFHEAVKWASLFKWRWPFMWCDWRASKVFFDVGNDVRDVSRALNTAEFFFKVKKKLNDNLSTKSLCVCCSLTFSSCEYWWYFCSSTSWLTIKCQQSQTVKNGMFTGHVNNSGREPATPHWLKLNLWTP